MGYDDLIRREIRRLNLEQRVKILPFVESCFLPAVYSLATIAAYPSRYEGFGIPVIEAINSGTPVIAATGSCLEEAGGPGALYVRPDFPNEFADAASRLLLTLSCVPTWYARERNGCNAFHAPILQMA